MKFSIAFTLAFASSASAEYLCHTDAFFTLDGAATPTQESQTQLDKVMLETFNEAYTSIKNVDVDINLARHGSGRNNRCGPLCDDDSDAVINFFEMGRTANSLLGGNTATVTGHQMGSVSWNNDEEINMASHGSGRNNRCGKFCDDDGSDINIATALIVSPEHALWEKLFCEKAHSIDGYSGLKDCTIVVSDCGHTDNAQEKIIKMAKHGSGRNNRCGKFCDDDASASSLEQYLMKVRDSAAAAYNSGVNEVLLSITDGRKLYDHSGGRNNRCGNFCDDDE